jgi:hypothetical protein
MQSLNFKSREVADVESEDFSDSMRLHRRDEARVVRLAAHHRVFDDQAPPFRVGARRVRQRDQVPLDLFDFRRRLRDGESEPIAGDWARENVPEFGDILRRETKCLATGDQPRDGLRGRPMVFVVRLRVAQQNVCVDEDTNSAPRAINAFAADRFLRQRRPNGLAGNGRKPRRRPFRGRQRRGAAAGGELFFQNFSRVIGQGKTFGGGLRRQTRFDFRFQIYRDGHGRVSFGQRDCGYCLVEFQNFQ